MLRSVIAIGLSLALQGGALSASLVHAHLDEHRHDHGGGRVVHAHLGGHYSDRHAWPADTRALRPVDEPDRIAYLQVFVAVHVDDVIGVGLPPGRFSLPTIAGSVMRRAPQMVRSHGPPQRRPSESRAPPTFLS